MENVLLFVFGIFAMIACVGAIFLVYEKSAEEYKNRKFYDNE